MRPRAGRAGGAGAAAGGAPGQPGARAPWAMGSAGLSRGRQVNGPRRAVTGGGGAAFPAGRGRPHRRRLRKAGRDPELVGRGEDLPPLRAQSAAVVTRGGGATPEPVTAFRRSVCVWGDEKLVYRGRTPRESRGRRLPLEPESRGGSQEPTPLRGGLPARAELCASQPRCRGQATGLPKANPAPEGRTSR